MKKNPDESIKIERYYGSRLYLDDIEKIEELFKERNYLIKITDKEYDYDTLKELIDKRGETPIELNIEGKDEKNNQKISIKIENEYINVYLESNSNDSSKLIYEEINKLCKSESIDKKLLDIMALVLFMIGLSIMLTSIKNNLNKLFLIGMAFTGLGLIITIYYSKKKTLKLIKRNKTGFWKNNLKPIVYLISGAIIGEIIRIIFNKIFK